MNVFDKNIFLLEEIFAKSFNDTELDLLRDVFLTTERDWKRQTIERGLKKIKFLLICEAPPFSENKPYKYFYTESNSSFHTRIWKIFFPNTNKPNNSDAVYQLLCENGFLLIDSIPFAMTYSSKHRKKTAYNKLINNSLHWWKTKLNDNFEFDNSTKIAFGFKLNAQSIIKESNNILNIKNNNYYVNKFNIGADGSGMTNSELIADIFDVNFMDNKNITNVLDAFLNSFIDDSNKNRIRRLKKIYYSLNNNEKKEIKKSLHYYNDLFESFDKFIN